MIKAHAPFDSLDDYYQFLRSHCSDGQRYVFRGQKNSAFNLQSSLSRFVAKNIRSSPSGEELWAIQRRLVELFLERTSVEEFGYTSRPEQSVVESAYFHSYCQHYGLPTYLLDWSYSAFAAAFFAMDGDELHSDNMGDYCRIYILNIDAFGRASRARFGNVGDFIIHDDKTGIDQLTDIGFVLDLKEAKNRRLRLQSGCFTNVPFMYSNMDRYIEREINSECVIQSVDIPTKNRNQDLRFLRDIGFSGTRIYWKPESSANDAMFDFLTYG